MIEILDERGWLKFFRNQSFVSAFEEPHVLPLLKCGESVRVECRCLKEIQVRKKNLHRSVLCVDTLEKAAAVELMPFS